VGWVKLATNFYRHPKSLAAGPNARNLYLAALAYSGEFNTDGEIAQHALPGIALDAGLIDADARDAVAALLRVGLWDLGADDEGEVWHVHDWADWQTTKAARAQAVAQAKERKRRWAERREAERNGDGNAFLTRSERSSDTEAEAEAEADRKHTPPTPTRAPKSGRQAGPDRYARALAIVSRERARSEPNVRSVDGLAARIRTEAEASGLADQVRDLLDKHPDATPHEIADMAAARTAAPPVVRPTDFATLRAAARGEVDQ